MIQVKNLTKSYQSGDSELVVLKNLSFFVPKGQFLSITGKSGSGKSTLLYQLGLLDHPNSGYIEIDGVDISKLNQDARATFRLNKLGYVFQDYALIPELSAVENVLIPLMMQGHTRAKAEEYAEIAMKRVGLSDRLNNLPSQLSGGQQQRVSIARAIAHNPQIIFADEPTANLDSETSRSVLQAFSDLHKQGQTIIMVTHELDYAELTDRIIVLLDGNIIEDNLQKK
ncbi:MAG: ABC transporter ATP-binding protein [Minisyncoccota bacterium]